MVSLRRHAWFAISFITLASLAAALALAYRFPPLQDWPQACLQASILRHFDEPSFRFAEFYRIESWFVPYQGFRFLQAALAAVLGDDLGMRAALLVYLVGMPCAFLAVLKGCGLDAWRSLGAFAIVVEANFLWGFAAHVMAVTLLLLAVAAALRAALTQAPRWLWVHMLLGVALFFTHPIVTAIWCATSAVIFAVAWQRGQLSPRQWLASNASIVPGAACLVFYLFFRGWMDGSALHDQGNQVYGGGFSWHAPWQAIIDAPRDSGLSSLFPAAAPIFLAAVLGSQLVGASSEREQQRDAAQRPWPWLLLGTWVALWLLLPADARSERVAARLASLVGLGLLLVPAWRRLNAGAWSRVLGRVLLVGSATVLLVSAHARFAIANEEVAPLSRLAELVPRGSKVAYVSYSERSRAFKHGIYEHLGVYVTVMRGGLTSLMFTRLGIDYAAAIDRRNLMLTAPSRPSGRQLKSGWTIPRNVADTFDYVLVRTGEGYLGRPISAADAAARMIGQAADLQLWKIEH